MLFGPSCISDI